MLAKTLKWPVISLIISGAMHFIIEIIWPDFTTTFFIPAVMAGLLLGYGVWVGYKAIQFGGTYLHAILAGVILGLLPLVMRIVGFGVILGGGVEPGMLAGIFGFTMIVWGSLLGSGFALSK